MVVHKDSDKIEHKQFKDILDYYDEHDFSSLMIRVCFLLVCLDTKRRQMQI